MTYGDACIHKNKLNWMWSSDQVTMEQKMRLYLQFVQIATYGAEAWIMDEETESLLTEWNAHNLACALRVRTYMYDTARVRELLAVNTELVARLYILRRTAYAVSVAAIVTSIVLYLA